MGKPLLRPIIPEIKPLIEEASTLTEQRIAEIMLGHKLPGSWQVYDHYDYLPEQGEAYKD